MEYVYTADLSQIDQQGWSPLFRRTEDGLVPSGSCSAARTALGGIPTTTLTLVDGDNVFVAQWGGGGWDPALTPTYAKGWTEAFEPTQVGAQLSASGNDLTITIK